MESATRLWDEETQGLEGSGMHFPLEISWVVAARGSIVPVVLCYSVENFFTALITPSLLPRASAESTL